MIATLAAVLYSLHQQHLYRGSAEVLLSRNNIAYAINNVTDPNIYGNPDRIAETQADLARVPEVALRAMRNARIRGRTASDLLAHSTVTPKPNADLLVFSVTDPIPAIADRLATAYARAYIAFRHQLETIQLIQARRELDTQIKQFALSGDTKSAEYINLVNKRQLLRLMELLQTKNSLTREATGAAQVQPRPLRNALLGFVLGVGLGVALAFLREALDTRVRSAEEVGARLGLPLLARLPEPPARLRNERKVAMLEEPDSIPAEAFRVLRTNLEFVNLERGAKLIMVTSALESEGKSTTVANLAVALARAGRRVIAVDLDLRRPYLDKLLGVGKRPGVTQVAIGQLDLEDALVPIPIREYRGRTVAMLDDDGWTNGKGSIQGSLEVLPAGPPPPNVGEFVGSRMLGEILEELRHRVDIVLVDSPPLLRVGDAITLSGRVDAMLIAANLGTIRRQALGELRRVLESCPAEKLGFVLTGANLEDGYGYGYGGSYTYRARPHAEAEPVH